MKHCLLFGMSVNAVLLFASLLPKFGAGEKIVDAVYYNALLFDQWQEL